MEALGGACECGGRSWVESARLSEKTLSDHCRQPLGSSCVAMCGTAPCTLHADATIWTTARRMPYTCATPSARADPAIQTLNNRPRIQVRAVVRGGWFKWRALVAAGLGAADFERHDETTSRRTA